MDTSKLQIALRASRGKAGLRVGVRDGCAVWLLKHDPGGLNFAANYFFVYAGRARHLYGDDRELWQAMDNTKQHHTSQNGGIPHSSLK